MRRILISGAAAAALAASLAVGGTALASTAHVSDGPGPVYVTSPAHEVHMWHVAHVEHEAYMASRGY